MVSPFLPLLPRHAMARNALLVGGPVATGRTELAATPARSRVALPIWRQTMRRNLGKALAQVARARRVEQLGLVLARGGCLGAEVVVMLDQHL